jgi:hypothetical protein
VEEDVDVILDDSPIIPSMPRVLPDDSPILPDLDLPGPSRYYMPTREPIYLGFSQDLDFWIPKYAPSTHASDTHTSKVATITIGEW